MKSLKKSTLLFERGHELTIKRKLSLRATGSAVNNINISRLVAEIEFGAAAHRPHVFAALFQIESPQRNIDDSINACCAAFSLALC